MLKSSTGATKKRRIFFLCDKTSNKKILETWKRNFMKESNKFFLSSFLQKEFFSYSDDDKCIH